MQISSKHPIFYAVNEGGSSTFDVIISGSGNPKTDKIVELLRTANFKVCDLRRDILPGVPTHPAEASVIEER